MTKGHLALRRGIYLLFLSSTLSACSGNPHLHGVSSGVDAVTGGHDIHEIILETAARNKLDSEFLIEMDTGSYCRAGSVWGSRLRNEAGALYGEKPTDPEFTSFLRTGEANSVSLKSPIGRFYFGVAKELKDKFNSCFRVAFDRLDADKVLGHHVAKAAGDIGTDVGSTFAQWPIKFSSDNAGKSKDQNGRFDSLVKEINDHATAQIDFFSELLTVGSPADRQSFKVGFVCGYRKAMTDALNGLKSNQAATIQKSVQPAEHLVKGVVCDVPEITGYHLQFSGKNNPLNTALPGLFYANHPTSSQGADNLGFRIFTGEELYLRYYRRALHEVGINLGKTLYHGLMSRTEGVEYVRNLALAVDRVADIKDFFAPGFLESFEQQGDIYLRDLLCEIDHTACPVIPVKNTAKSRAKASEKKTSQPIPKASAPAKSSGTSSLSPPVVEEGKHLSQADVTWRQCFVDVGVFSDKANTDAAANKLSSLGVLDVLTREITYKTSGQEQVGTQVRLGPYPSRTMAQQELNRLSASMPFKIGGIACSEASQG